MYSEVIFFLNCTMHRGYSVSLWGKRNKYQNAQDVYFVFKTITYTSTYILALYNIALVVTENR